MNITEETLRQTYESQTLEQLLQLRARGTLTELAQQVLERVLDERRVSPADRDQMTAAAKQQIDLDEKKTRSVASLFVRLAGQFFDLIFTLVLLMVGFGIAFIVISTKTGVETSMAAALIIVSALPGTAYWLFADGLPLGQSLGKRVLGTAVVGVGSMKPCSYSQSFARNLLPLLIGPFDLLPLLGERRQRLGDVIAGTIVINMDRYQGPDRLLQAAASRNVTRA